MITAEQIPDCIIIVIDDEPDNLDVVRRVLKYYKATVYSAGNGKEGLEILRQVKPDFIITDLSMPVMDGWEFVFRVKEDPRTKDIPIFALTAHVMPGDRERTIAAGFHNYLTKPLSPMIFLQQLLGVLGDIELNRNEERAPSAGLAPRSESALSVAPAKISLGGNGANSANSHE